MDALHRVINDQVNLWQRLSRLTKLPDFERFYEQYPDKELLLEAVKLGDEVILKNEYETWKVTDWQSKPVTELRLLATRYNIPYASKLPKDLLVMKLQEKMSNKRVENG